MKKWYKKNRPFCPKIDQSFIFFTVTQYTPTHYARTSRSTAR